MATVVFFPEGAFGPTNNCVGIGDVLRSRGHRVVFIVEESFAGTLEARGFEERLMRLGPAPEVEEAPGQFWKDFIRDTAPTFRKPTIEQLGEFLEPTWRALADGSRYVNPRLEEIIGELEPAVICEDNVPAFPALPACGRPWVRIVSCNPLEVRDPGIPPVFSGYAADDRTGWDEFEAERDRTHRPLWAEFNEFCQEAGAPALPDLEFIHASPYLNLYVYPEELDYRRARPLDGTWHRLESCVRSSDADFEIPPTVRDGEGALIYLSLGSLGSADVDLMRRLVEVLGETRHRYIVSKGPQHDLYDLAPNMWGEEFVPQPSILPAGRPRHHARRQQHDDRVPALRKADGRAAALLGSVRQRPACRRHRLRRASSHVRVRARRDVGGDRPPARRRGPAAPARRDGRPPSGEPRHGHGGRPDRARRGVGLGR